MNKNFKDLGGDLNMVQMILILFIFYEKL